MHESDEWLRQIIAAAEGRAEDDSQRVTAEAQRIKADSDRKAELAKANRVLLERERARLLEVVQHAYDTLHSAGDRGAERGPSRPGFFRDHQTRGWRLGREGNLTTTGHVLIHKTRWKKELSLEEFVAQVLDPIYIVSTPSGYSGTIDTKRDRASELEPDDFARWADRLVVHWAELFAYAVASCGLKF